MPTTPVPIAAVSNRRVGDQPDLAANPALYLIASMNRTARRPKTGPATKRRRQHMTQIDADTRQIKDMGRTEKGVAEPHGRHASDSDWRNRTHGKMSQNSLMREDNPGNWRIETCGDSSGHSATDEYISAKHAACGLP